MIRPGLSFRETLRGSYYRLDAPTQESALDLHLEASALDLRRFSRDRTLVLRGTLHAEGLVAQAPLDGTLSLRLVRDGRLPYRLRFRGDDGLSYELSGQKEWLPVAPLDSVTTLPASLYDEAGQEIGRALLRFDLRAEGLRFLRSFRLHLLA